ncbi:MAG TPA: hypothetical protein VGF94_16665 [Kofleriaceae bacterium]|jgi:hypothetical protein
MRWLAFAVVLPLVACGNDHAAPQPDASNAIDWSKRVTFPFGPYMLQAEQEITADCVQITLNNDADIYINEVDFHTDGPGFHHSNWFWVPESTFPGPSWNGSNSSVDDGTYNCNDRHFDQGIAGLFGGVVFAQSTQSQQEAQQFPTGYAIKIPAHSKLVSTIHLLNPGDNSITVNPEISLTPIATSQLVRQLAGISFENEALALPPNMQSSFAVTCDMNGADQTPPQSWPAPDFKIYYALAHYHALGTGLTLEALKPDGTATTVYSTVNVIGDSLGAPIAPAFDFTGYQKLRFTCDYYNTTASTVVWGNGSEEMCVFLAFSDSTYNFGGGVVTDTNPGPGTMVDNVMTFTHACDTLIGNPLN